MSKLPYVAACLLTAGLAFLPGGASAAVIQTSQELLSVCPALSSGIGCAAGASQYLGAAQPSNAQIVKLVTSIAEAADSPEVPKPICLDAAQGIRVLAEGLSSETQREQVLVIADDLCKGSATAAIPATAVNNSNGNTNGSGSNGNGNGNAGGGGNGSGGNNGGGNGGGGDDDGGNGILCAGNSSPGNGNNCSNNNQSHSH
jgi:hypothetical protein